MPEKAKINPESCIQCGVCVSLNPAVFHFMDDGSIGVDAGEAGEAVASCPAGAISQ